jgi:hypothetical protein
VDTVMELRKSDGQHDAQLQIRPREEQEATLALAFDQQLATWRLEGNANEFAKTRSRQVILDALRKVTSDGDPAGPRDVADACPEKSYDVVRQRLPKLVDEGMAEKVDYGKYMPVHTPPSHPSHPSQLSQPSQASHSDTKDEEVPF